MTREWIIFVDAWFLKVCLNSWKSVFEKVLAGLLQMELVSSASSRRQARWAFVFIRNLDSYPHCLRVASIFVYLLLSLFDETGSANDATMTNDHSLNLCLWSKGEYWKRWVWSGRGWSTEMSLLRLPWSQRFSFIKMIQGIFFIHGPHKLALAVPYPFFLQVLLNVLSSASWLETENLS